MEVQLQLDHWAEIHPDLLDEIVKRVNSYGDYIRLRAVCINWNLILPKIPRHMKHLFLVLPFHNKSDITRPFYHIAEKKVTHHLELPETKNTIIRGSCYRWLITIGLDGALQMLEPFTRAQIHLAPLSTFPDVADYQPNRHGEEYTRISSRDGSTYPDDKFSMQKDYVEKIILSSPPDDDDQDFMAIAIYGEFYGMAYCRRGDKRWTDFPIPTRAFIKDAIFHEGKIHAVNRDGWMYEYDMNSLVGGISGSVPQHEFHCYYHPQRYLVWMREYGMLSIVRKVTSTNQKFINDGKRITNSDNFYYHTFAFHIYKLSKSTEGKPTWLEVNSLGDYVLLLGLNSSVAVLPHRVSLNKGNCIYYTDDGLFSQNPTRGGYDIGIFDLEDGTFHRLFPNEDQLYPSPIWLQ